MKDKSSESQWDIRKERVIITPEVGEPYLHFDEMLYMKKAKIQMDRRTGGDDIWYAVIFVIPLLFRIIKIPYNIYKQRKLAYQIYLEECSERKSEFKIHYSSSGR